jgi:hypothetical protein
MKEITLKEAYDMLKRNVRYSSADCAGFVYLSQIEELLQNQKYDMDLVAKIHNREAVIDVDDFSIIKDLINFIYPDDPYLEDEHETKRVIYYSMENPFFNYKITKYYKKYFWGSNINESKEMDTKPRINASQFLLK